MAESRRGPQGRNAEFESVGQKLAAALAERLSEVIPVGFKVTSRAGWLKVSSVHGGMTQVGVSDIADHDGRTDGQIISAAYGALNAIQDLITEEMTLPWPPNPTNRLHLLLPMAGIFDGMLEMGYGETSDFTLRIRSIAVDELRGHVSTLGP